MSRLLLGAAGAVALLAYMTPFTVEEWEKAIRFRLGEIVQYDYRPGLHFKMPLINNVRKFDARVQTLESEPERFLTAEKKNVLVEAFVKWRIVDVARYYTAVGGDRNQANLRLDQIIKDGLRSEFGSRQLHDAVSGDRQQLISQLSVRANEEARQLGLEIIDVRIRRIDLPQEVSTSVFRRMRAERERVARDFRSRGAEAAERIRADADRQSTVLLAEAYRDAERLRGEGDAAAASIYAAAFGQDPEFYRFHRSLQAYRDSLNSRDDLLLMSQDSHFFDVMRNPLQHKPAVVAPPAAPPAQAATVPAEAS